MSEPDRSASRQRVASSTSPHILTARLFYLRTYHFQLHLNAQLCFFFLFFSKQLSKCGRRFFFAIFLFHIKSFIWVTTCVSGRKWGWEFGARVDSASNYPTSPWKAKMLSVFKQLVHVATASASFLHFPVSQRQMNRNVCFVLLCLPSQAA